MTRLTEEMVIARSKLSDLSQIKKLNCWGTELSDVSILRKMRGVEVLALSVNQITTLQDFIYCTKLQELYLRRNKIDDLNELAYLQSLPALKYLWLEENPCVERYKDNYRNIVIRMLPNLEKLDNQEITPQEREKAYSDNGYEPARDDDGAASAAAGYGYDSYEQEQSPQHQQQQSAQAQQRAAQQQQQQQQEQYEQQQREEQQRRAYAQSQKERSPGSDQESPQMPMREVQSAQHPHQQQRQQPMPSSMSTHSMKEYYQSERPAYPVQYRHSQTDLTEWDEHQQHYGSTAQLPQQGARASAGSDRFGSRVSSVRENGDCDDPERPPRTRRIDPRHENVFNHHFSACHRRPVNRNSNILSATLCLLKELDYNSLEVVEHAVRCRFDELSIE